MGRGNGSEELLARSGRDHDRLSHVENVFRLERAFLGWLPRRRRQRQALLAELDHTGRLDFGLQLIKQVEKRPKTPAATVRNEFIAQIALDGILAALADLPSDALDYENLRPALTPLLASLQTDLDRGRDQGLIGEDAWADPLRRPELVPQHPQLAELSLQHLNYSGAFWMARALRTLDYAARLRAAAPAPTSHNLARTLELCEQHARRLEELLPKLCFENGVPPGARRLEDAVRYFSNAYAIVMLDDEARALNEQLDPLFEGCRSATEDYLGAACPDPLLSLPDEELIRALMSVNAKWAPSGTTFAFRNVNGGIIVGPKTTEKALRNLKRGELSHVLCHEIVHSSQDLRNSSYVDGCDLLLIEGATEWLARRISQRPTKKFHQDSSPYYAYPAWTDMVDEFSKLVAPGNQADLLREMSQSPQGQFTRFAVSCVKNPRLMGQAEFHDSAKFLESMVFVPVHHSYAVGTFGGYREEGQEFALRSRLAALLEVNFPYYKDEVARRRRDLESPAAAAATTAVAA